MPARKRNRRVIIQQRVTTQEATYGTQVEAGWVPYAYAWAEVQDMLPSRGERLAEGVNIARRPCRIRIPYRTGITSAMRVKLGDRTLRIISQPAELGNRDALEFMAEELTSAGQEP